MCLIWLNMHLFSWRLVLRMSLSLQVVMECNVFNIHMSFWIEMDSKTRWTDVGSFMQMLRIQKLVLFLAGNSWLHGILFYYWDIYDMLWCSQYCVIIPMGVPCWWKMNISLKYIIFDKGMIWEVNFNVERLEMFVPSIISEPGDQPLPNLLLCSPNFSYEKYLSLLVWVTSFYWGYAVCATHYLYFLCFIIQKFRIWCDGVYITSECAKFTNARIFTIPWKVRWYIV